jgi:hypothetical protein
MKITIPRRSDKIMNKSLLAKLLQTKNQAQIIQITFKKGIINKKIHHHGFPIISKNTKML